MNGSKGRANRRHFFTPSSFRLLESQSVPPSPPAPPPGQTDRRSATTGFFGPASRFLPSSDPLIRPSDRPSVRPASNKLIMDVHISASAGRERHSFLRKEFTGCILAENFTLESRPVRVPDLRPTYLHFWSRPVSIPYVHTMGKGPGGMMDNGHWARS